MLMKIKPRLSFGAEDHTDARGLLLPHLINSSASRLWRVPGRGGFLYIVSSNLKGNSVVSLFYSLMLLSPSHVNVHDADGMPACCAGMTLPLAARCSNCLRLHLDFINAQLKKAPSIFKFYYSRQALMVQSILLERCLQSKEER